VRRGCGYVLLPPAHIASSKSTEDPTKLSS
jgi:hypothetical protein